MSHQSLPLVLLEITMMSMVLPNTWRCPHHCVVHNHNIVENWHKSNSILGVGFQKKWNCQLFRMAVFVRQMQLRGQGQLNSTWGATDKPTHKHFAQWEKNNFESLNSLVKNCEEFQATLKSLNSASLFRVAELQMLIIEQTAEELWTTWLTQDHFSQYGRVTIVSV